MNRWLTVLATLAISLSFAAPKESMPFSSSYVFEGTATTLEGGPVPGAEVRIFDETGKQVYRVLTDMEGRYRFPAITPAADIIKSYAIEVLHPRCPRLKIDAALSGAQISLSSAIPSQPLASSSELVVRRDLVMNLSLPERNSDSASEDPNDAEMIYQQALLALDQDRKRALELFNAYVRTGQNAKQVGRALLIIAGNEK